jgi:hypothetical protein
MTTTDTQTVHLIGGPLDGDDMDDVPTHCIELYADTDYDTHRHHYHYCPHATARLGKPCFTHHHVAHDLYSR